jgi:hypothetical protein
MADDTAYVVPGNTGTVMAMYALTTGAVSGNRINGLLLARTDTSPTISALTTMGANVTLTTVTVLTGTTGTDGNFTVSATNGNLYFENRSGGSLTITIQRLTDIIMS